MKHKKLLTNLLFAAVVLAIAAVLLLVRSAHSSGSKLRAELIYGDNNTTMNLPLDKNDTYDVDTGYYTVHIEVKDGAARFVDSPCPDHICESFGWLSNEDQTATCLPARAVLTIVPADTENFQINFEAFEEMLTEKVKAVLINTPNNPSGVVYSTPTLQRLADILSEKSKEYGHIIYLISDEPYREIVFEGVDSPCVSYFYDNTIMCYSFSKSLSLPGERIGYVAVNPACEDAETMINMCGQISRGIGHNCPPSIIQLAVAQVLDKTADLSVYETNMNILYKELTELGFTCVKPGGTFYIFPKALEEDAKVFSQKALKYDLVLVPGDSFGAPGYFRMAYCVDTEKVERSLEALRKFVKTEYATI